MTSGRGRTTLLSGPDGRTGVRGIQAAGVSGVHILSRPAMSGTITSAKLKCYMYARSKLLFYFSFLKFYSYNKQRSAFNGIFIKH